MKLQTKLTHKTERAHHYKAQLKDQQEKERMRKLQRDMQKKIEAKIAEHMDACDRRSRYKKDDADDAEEREKESMNKDLLVKKLEKQIKTLKTLNDN